MSHAALDLFCRWLGLLALLTVGAAYAQDRGLMAREQRIALVVGNSAYQNGPLRNPANDVDDMAAALQGLGFRVTKLKNASNRQMVEAINRFGQELRKGGVGLFFFAGHGVQSRGRNFLIPVGANIGAEEQLEFESVDANRVLAAMDAANNRVNIMILDACRDNPYARSFRSGSRGLAQMEAARGSLVAFATGPGSVASDGTARNGLYTQHLLQSLNHPDSDIDKVFRRVTAEVARASGNKQVPWKQDSLTGEFHFRLDGGANVALAAPIAPTEPTTQPAPAASMETAVDFSPGSTFRDCDACPEMVVIPPGSFSMGSPMHEQGRDVNEGPQHSVSIPRAMAVGKQEVTRGEYAQFVRETRRASSGCFSLKGGKSFQNDPSASWQAPGYTQDDIHPVVCVDWNDAKAYAAWLSRKSSKNYRLLTEAEWEYAARAGTNTAYYWGDNAHNACQYANGADEALKTAFAGAINAVIPCSDNYAYTAPVGSFQANAFGLHDMTGNAWEWTEDCWNANYNGAPTQGGAWTSGDCGQRVLRGGSWEGAASILRSAVRGRSSVSFRLGMLGFRVARTQ